MSYAAAPAIAPDMTSDATFRVWAKALSDALAAMGLVRTADTGQVPAWTSRTFSDAAMTNGSATLTSAAGANFTANDVGMQINIAGVGAAGATLQTSITAYTSATQVTVANAASTTASGQSATIGQRKPSAANTANGYEVWRFDDALQATLGVFFKLEYGTGNTTSDPGLWLTVGTSTNGSGTITGQAQTRRALAINSVGGATTKTCVFSGDTNRVAAILFSNHTQSIGFTIERTKDGTGADTSAGILINMLVISSGFEQLFIPATGAVPAVFTVGQCLVPTGATTGINTPTTSIYTLFHVKNGALLNPGMNMHMYFNADISADSVANISIYGNNHAYYFLGGQSRTAYSQVASSNIRPCVRYE